MRGFAFHTRHACLTAMLLVSGTIAVPTAPALAQSAAMTAAYDFNIPAGPLGSSLNRFADISGLQLIYDAGITQGRAAAAVTGRMNADKALSLLLSGSGITYRMNAGNTVTLEKVTAEGALLLDPVAVDGQGITASQDNQTALTPVRGYVATRAVTGTKTDTPLIETPQSISVVTRDQLEQQNVQNLNQAVRYTAGVTPETRGAVATRYDMLTVRGFDADKYLNGMKLTELYYITEQIDPYLLERVDVLKGPTSVMYGQAPAGGLLNQVSKHPTDTPYHEVGMEVGNDGHFRSSADFSGPMDAAGKFLYRFTATGLTEEGQIEHTDNERVAVAPAFTWKPDSDTRLTLLGMYQTDPRGNSYGSVPPEGTVLYNPLGRLPTNFYDGDSSFEKFNRQEKSLGYEFDRRLNDMWSVRSNARAMRTTMAYDSVYASSLAADNRTLNRGTARSREELNSYSTDNQIEARVQTGPVRHTLLGGVDYRYDTGNYDVGFGSAPNLDIFAPVYGQTITAPALTRTDVDGDQLGFYAQDQLRWNNFILTLGGRHDRATKTSTTNGVDTEQDDSAWTGKAGLTYVFANGVAPYVSYSQSFTPQAGVDYAGHPFDPETGEQYEVGVKYQPAGGKSLYTAAVFDLTRNNVLTGDPNHTNFSIQTGESRSRGFELEAHTALTDHLDVIGAYTYLDTKVVKDNSGLEGNRLGAVPRHQAAAWAMYHMPDGTELEGVSFGGGVRYVGSTNNPENTIRVPSFTLFDAAVTYDLRALSEDLDGAELALNVKNLFDNRYVASCYYGEWCAYGYDRTITAGLRYRW